MDANSLTQSPFAALTFVAAPALLTNASSVLALGTINRMLRTRDRMHELFDESKSGVRTDEERKHLTEVTDRVEKQAALLLTALHAIYSALAAFASATLVTLLGAGLTALHGERGVDAMALLGLLLGFFGAGGLVLGCVNLFRATQLSLVNIRDEAALIRARSSATLITKRNARNSRGNPPLAMVKGDHENDTRNLRRRRVPSARKGGITRADGGGI